MVDIKALKVNIDCKLTPRLKRFLELAAEMEALFPEAVKETATVIAAREDRPLAESELDLLREIRDHSAQTVGLLAKVGQAQYPV